MQGRRRKRERERDKGVEGRYPLSSPPAAMVTIVAAPRPRLPCPPPPHLHTRMNTHAHMQPCSRMRQVNAALEEMAGHAEANSRLLAAARSQQTAKHLAPAERKRATELLHSVAVRVECTGFVCMYVCVSGGGGVIGNQVARPCPVA